MKPGDIFIVGGKHAGKLSYDTLVGRNVVYESTAGEFVRTSSTPQSWVKEAGEDTYYSGLWHVADEDLLPLAQDNETALYLLQERN